MTRTSADIEREVEATRGQIDQTVEALKAKMQPKELFDEASRYMGAASNRTLTMMTQHAKQNSLPLALVGLGLAWMVMGRRRPAAVRGPRDYDAYDGYDPYDAYQGVGRRPGANRLKGRVDEAVGAAKDAFDGAKDRISDAVDQAKDGLAEVRSHVGESAEAGKIRVSALAQSAQDQAERLSRQAQARYRDVLNAEPLVIGAIGLALGAAMGAALPATSLERRYIGPTGDKVLGRGKQMARQSLGDVKHAAERAYGQAKAELHLNESANGSTANGAF